jgi:hypothetical protein
MEGLPERDTWDRIDGRRPRQLPAIRDFLHKSRLSVSRLKERSPARSSDGIFISYRRLDEPGFAGRLYDRLEARFSKEQVFRDVDSIELGVDFAEELERVLNQCAALITVIGKNWLTAIDPFGYHRLDDPDDLVRLEIEIALARDIRVIPILVDGARMPASIDLPPTLAPLTRRNGCEMSHARFGSDVLELISTLERVLAT